MKHLLILTVGICLLLTLVPAVADQGGDEAAIREVIDKLYAAYNKHDPKAVSDLRIEDYEGWRRGHLGRVALEKYLSDAWERQKDRQYSQLEEIGIVFVTPIVAIHKGRWEITGRLDADGKSLPSQKQLTAMVLVKESGQWLLAATFTRPIEQ